eukprot:scaffold10764_cov159-Ochromonas_danica.AAC.13
MLSSSNSKEVMVREDAGEKMRWARRMNDLATTNHSVEETRFTISCFWREGGFNKSGVGTA